MDLNDVLGTRRKTGKSQLSLREDEKTYLLQVNLGISTHAGLTNEVDNPLFTLIAGEV